MREIKFRGKRIDNGEWVYGGIDLMDGDSTIFDHSSVTHSSYDIYPETVGQFTGLHDKNGKEIYEGDIVQVWRAKGENGELRGKYVYPMPIEYSEMWTQFVAVDKPNKEQFGLWQQFEAFEVIGNIHDNPELVK